MDNVTRQAWGIVLTIIALELIPASFLNTHGAEFRTGGDWGCTTNAQTNLKNIAKDQTKSFMGLGDYVYSCNTGSKTFTTLWNNITSKKGVPGNHECEKGQGTKWASQTFGYGDCKTKGYFAVIRGGNTGVIGLNPYGDYKKGTGQYNYVVSKTNQYKNDSSIKWIVYLIHDPLYPIGCSGSHCHDLEISGFKKVYEPIIKSSGKEILIQAHTHLTGAGKINNVPVAVCGGGGEDKTNAVSNTRGYQWETSKPGFCLVHTESDIAMIQLIGLDGQPIHTQTWSK